MTTQLQLLPDSGCARLSELVYQSLLEAILSGQLAAGHPVSELAVARQLDVSRTPVHEAIGQLIKDGLVQQEANCRPVVASFTSADISDIFDMRLLLEPAAAAGAAEQMDRVTLKELSDECDQLRSERKSPDFVKRWAEHDHHFHSAIAAACGSPRLEQDILRYRRLHRGINCLFNTASGLNSAVSEHAKILKSLKRRDGESAALAMAEHIREWKTFFVQAAMRSER